MLKKIEMEKIFGILGVCLLVAFQLQAQTPIQEQQFDASLLQKLIHEKVDSVRKAYQKQAFASDPILQKAADDHAEYLAKKRTLSHFQEGNKKKYNPQDRVVYFGGEGYLTGENAAEHPVKVLLVKGKGLTVSRVENYEQSALLFVQQWVNSPMHFQNLMRDDYTLTGIAVSLDPKDKRIYAVQVFSPEPYKQ
jgi:uncharacterized protein YkwD